MHGEVASGHIWNVLRSASLTNCEISSDNESVMTGGKVQPWRLLLIIIMGKVVVIQAFPLSQLYVNRIYCRNALSSTVHMHS